MLDFNLVSVPVVDKFPTHVTDSDPPFLWVSSSANGLRDCA